MKTNELVFDVLPDMLQLRPLSPFATAVWRRPEVLALWIGGSIARGDADRYSDVDVAIAVQEDALETWKQPWVPSLFEHPLVVGYRAFPLGEQAFLHHCVLVSGDIYDVVVRSVHVELPPGSILILGCRDDVFSERLGSVRLEPALPDVSASPEVIRELIVDFWINTHKHRKVLDRGLHLVAQAGVEMERAWLLRLWYVAVTGEDCGKMRSQTIFVMTQMMRTLEKARGAEALTVMGASLADRAAICGAIEQLRDEVTKVGRALADTLGFSYPLELEAVARRGWQEYTRP